MRTLAGGVGCAWRCFSVAFAGRGLALCVFLCLRVFISDLVYGLSVCEVSFSFARQLSLSVAVHVRGGPVRSRNCTPRVRDGNVAKSALIVATADACRSLNGNDIKELNIDFLSSVSIQQLCVFLRWRMCNSVKT